MGYSEFPHTVYRGEDNMYDFIKLYTQLSDEYGGTLAKITNLETRLTNYETNVASRFRTLSEVTMPELVSSTVERELQPFNTQLDEIRGNIMVLQARANGHDTMIEALNTKLVQLETRVEALSTRLTTEVERLEGQITEAMADAVSNAQDYTDRVTTEINNSLIDKINRNDAAARVRELAVEERAERYTDEQARQLQLALTQLEIASDKAALKWLWNNGCNAVGYTALEWFNDVAVSAKDWKDRTFNCVDWYVRGREIFKWFDRRTLLFSPFTGELETPGEIIIEICNYLKVGGITAKEYDDMNITASDYEAKKITAVEYDWNGKEILNV